MGGRLMPATTTPTSAWPLVYVGLHHVTGDDFPEGQRRSVEMFARLMGVKGVRCPVVLQNMGATYSVVSGRRRVAASRLLGLRIVPALVAPAPVNPKMLVAVNALQSEDTTLTHRIGAARDLLAAGWDVPTLALAIGRSRSHLEQMLTFDRLPAEAFALLESGGISHTVGKDLVSLLTNGASKERVAALAQQIAGTDGTGKHPLVGEAAAALIQAEMESLGKQRKGRAGRPAKVMSTEVRPSLRDVLGESSDPKVMVLAEGLLRIDRALTFVELERVPGAVRQIVDHTLREVRKCRS